MVFYNPLDKFYKSITGAIKENTPVTFRVVGNFDCVSLVIRSDNDNSITHHEMKNSGEFFEVTLKLTKGLYFYHFLINDNLYSGLGENYLGEIKDNLPEFQLTCYDENYIVPQWIQGGIMYQIFPDRFCRKISNKNIKKGKVLHKNWNDCPVYLPDKNGKILNNDFFGGDFQGIISKIDYLKELNVNCIYINPVFEAYSNHRYDTGNYFQIDSLLGSSDDFKELICKCHNNGIKIILDGVFNHTGDDSVYFNKYRHYNSCGAYNSKNSPYYKWYEFNNYPDDYKAWWGVLTLPQINKTSPEFAEFIAGEKGVIPYYNAFGVDGWRLDVVDELSKSFSQKIRRAVKSTNKDALIIGEVWEDVTNKISYGERREYFQGSELDSAMNYPLKDAIIDFVRNKNTNRLSLVIKEQIDHYPKQCIDCLMNILSTHDTIRIMTMLGGIPCDNMTIDEMAETVISKDKINESIFMVKVASLIQFTLYGVPCIYYGDEVGMEGYRDPLNRRTYPWGKGNSELYSWYKKIGKIRKTYSCFVNGEFSEIYSKNGCFIYKRTDEKSEVLIAINLSKIQINMSFDGNLTDILTSKEYNSELNLSENQIMVLVNTMEM